MSYFIHKWLVGFLLVLLLYAANARLSEPDWSNLDKEIDDGRWCEEGDHCRPRLTNSSAEEDDGSWKEMNFAKPSEMDDEEFEKKRCHCDDECDTYGDCCYDAPATDRRTVENNNKEGEFGRNSWSCLPLRFGSRHQLDEMYHIYMIDSCPTSWSNEDDKSLPALCQRNPERSDYSYLMDLPVLSLNTNRTYANIYCARCHSDAARLASWNASMECSKDYIASNVSRAEMFDPLNYKAGLRRWVLDEPSITCHIVVKQFLNFRTYLQSTGSRRCLPRRKAICATDWEDPSDRIKCQSYTLLVHGVRHRSSIPFKNPHCAKCNHIKEYEDGSLNIRCFERHVIMFGTPRGGPLRLHSFAMLLDLNFGGGSGGGSQEEYKCEPNEIFDHIREQCQAISCGSMFLYQSGICVRKNQSEINQDNWPTGLNSSCPRVTLVENMDYVQLDNGSIVLNSTGQVLQPEEYERNEGQNITICAKENRPGTYFNYSPAQRYLSDLCLVISVVCLALHIAIHIALPKLRNLPGKNLLSLSCALFMAQLLFLTGMVFFEAINDKLCQTMGILVHWFYLAAFFWMNVMGFDICRTFAGSLTRRGGMPGRGQRSTFLYYSLYAWGFPTFIVALGLMLDLSEWMDDYAPLYGRGVCWIANRSALGVFFVVPVAALLLENLILFSLTVYSILQQRRAAQFAVDKNQSYRTASESKSVTERLQPPSGSTAPSRQQSKTNNKQQIRFILYIKLGLIMGLGWIFGFAASLAKVPVLWYPFIFFNALQGAFIFFAFGCKRKVYYMMYHWATNRPHPSDTSSSTRTTASSNKPSVSNQSKTSFTSPSSTANDFESNPNRLSAVDIHVPHVNNPVRYSISQHRQY